MIILPPFNPLNSLLHLVIASGFDFETFPPTNDRSIDDERVDDSERKPGNSDDSFYIRKRQHAAAQCLKRERNFVVQ